ncbi:MAG: NTP transferase domain-containing protein [Candidatus Doudnabacteria bacterium]|nr:NTP transferase domain-containing protein [Candidatus Doudnabacteria bacterium]
MNAIVFAGGNQSRFGSPQASSPKVLYSLSDGRTVLSNILDQLEAAHIDRIIVCAADKQNIAQYVAALSCVYKTPIEINTDDLAELGDYVFAQSKLLPAAFIFGDIYFPPGTLTNYMQKLKESKSGDYVGMIGASRLPVGDFHVQVKADIVTRIAKDGIGDYYTCGVFSVLAPSLVSGLNHSPKITSIFSELAEVGRLAYYVMDGLVDLDTQDMILKIPLNERGATI